VKVLCLKVGETTMPGVQVGEVAPLTWLPSQEEAVVMAAASAVKMGILPGNVLAGVVEEGTTSAGTANKRVTWPMTVPSQRSVGGAERKGTRWLNVQCHKNVSTVEKKVTPRPTVQNQ